MILVTHDLLVTVSGEVGMIFSQADLMISLGNDLLGQEMKLPKHQTYRTKVRINKTNSSSQRLSGKCQVNLGVWGGIQALTLLCSRASQMLDVELHIIPAAQTCSSLANSGVWHAVNLDGILHGIETLTNISNLGELDLFHHQFTKISSDFGFLISYPDPSKGIKI